VGGTFLKAVLSLCFATLVLFACSEEPDKPESAEKNAEAGRAVVGGIVAPGEGNSPGPAGEPGGGVAIEEAVLTSGERGDEIHVWVRFWGPGTWPYCFLMDGPTKDTVERAIKRQHPSLAPPQVESRWVDQDSTEKFLSRDRMVIWVFHEDRDPTGEAADPRRTPFFAACEGGQGPKRYVEAHVEGTPEPP
jgi:hypothetical protein